MDLTHLLIEATHDAVYLCDCKRDARGRIVDFVCVDVNAQGLHDLKLTRAELLGRGLRDVFTLQDMLPFFQICADVAESGRVRDGDYDSAGTLVEGLYRYRVVATPTGVLICNHRVGPRRAREVTAVKRRSEPDRAEVASSVPNASPKLKVLVVDDEAAIRRALTATLRGAGYELFEAGDGQEALDLLETEHVDLVVTDLRMPRIDGLRLAEILKRSRPTLPVCLLSGWATPAELAARGLERMLLLEKPIHAQDLLDAVAAVLAERVSAAS